MSFQIYNPFQTPKLGCSSDTDCEDGKFCKILGDTMGNRMTLSKKFNSTKFDKLAKGKCVTNDVSDMGIENHLGRKAVLTPLCIFNVKLLSYFHLPTLK